MVTQDRVHQQLPSEEEDGLVRGITPLGLAAGVVNVVVGGGIFVLPALLAAHVGAVAPWVHFIGGGAVFLVATSFVTIGRAVSRSGGSYAYVAAVLGPFAGYLTGVLTWAIGAFASAALLVALAAIVALLHPSLQTITARPALILLLYMLPLAINLVRIGFGARLVIVLTFIKLGTLLAFLIFALPQVQGEYLTWTGPLSSSELARATIITFFAFGGMEMALGASGEIQSPGRTLPWAVPSGMGLVVLLYAAVQTVAQGVLGPALPHSAAPLADAAARVHPGLRGVIVLGTAVSIYGALVGTLQGSARTLFAFARNGILPGGISSVHARSRIPHRAVLLHAAVVLMLAVTGSFAKLAILTSVAVALVYLAACTSAWILSRRDDRARARDGVHRDQILSALGSIVLVLLLTQSTRAEVMAIGITLAAAAILYIARRPQSTAARTAGSP